MDQLSLGMRFHALLRLFLIGATVGGAFAQVSLFPASVLENGNLLQPDSSYATRQTISVTGQPFTRAVRFVVRKPSSDPWGVQLNMRVPRAISKNDVLHAIFYLRTAAASPALTEFVFEKASPNYDQSVRRVVSEDAGDWTRVQIAFASIDNYAANAAQINFRLGYSAQTIELAGLAVTNYGTTKSVSDFPVEITYPGQSPNAPWRAAANERIEQLRQADLTVKLKHPDGSPAPNVPVGVHMTRHQFGFGTAVSAAQLLTGTQRARYSAIVTQLFNRVVLENDLKWPNWESNPSLARNAVDWFNAREIPVRGHNLIWPAWRWMPSDVQDLAGSPAALRSRIDQHFTNELTSLRGKILEWDVINEPWSERDVMDVLGDAEMAEWFRIAKALDPAARLMVNDYGNIENAGLNSTHADGTLRIIRYLLEQGAPLEGIGLQGHFSEYLSAPESILATLDRFAAFGLPLAITEIDVDVPDRQAQANYTRDLLTVLFSHPAVDSILFWGFWEAAHWRPNAALFDRDFSMRPNGVAYSNLVYRTWWTETNLVTGADGAARLRGFKGRYELTVPTMDGSRILPLDLSSNQLFEIEVEGLQPPELKIRSMDSMDDTIEITVEPAVAGVVESTPSLETPDWKAVEPLAEVPGGSGGSGILKLPAAHRAEFFRFRFEP